MSVRNPGRMFRPRSIAGSDGVPARDARIRGAFGAAPVVR